MKKSIAYVAAISILAFVAYSSRDAIESAVGIEPESISATAPQISKRAPQSRAVQLCIDPSGSTASSFARSIKSSVLKSVAEYLPKKPTVTRTGVNGVAALDIAVRLVSSKPLAYGAPYYEVSLPTVMALPARPDMSAAGALDPGGSYEKWKDREGSWSQQYDVATAEAHAAVTTLRKIDLSQRSHSGVHDCLGALASTPLETSEVTYVVASDLQDNTDGESKVSFRGRPLVIIQACPSGDAGECRAVLGRFNTWAKGREAGEIKVVRPEVSGDVIRNLIEGD